MKIIKNIFFAKKPSFTTNNICPSKVIRSILCLLISICYSISPIYSQCSCQFRGDATGGSWVTEADCTFTICKGEEISMRGPSGSAYEWRDPSGTIVGTGRIFPINKVMSASMTGPVTYSLSVNNGTTCTGSFTVQVVGAEVNAVNPTCAGGSDGSISINNSIGSGTYTYSIDGSTFQTSTTFSNLSAGSYPIYIKDADASDTCLINQIVLEGNPVTAYAMSASCEQGIAQDNAYLQISVAEGNRYHYSIGNSFNDNGGMNTYTNANPITTTPLTFATLPNPSNPTDYTIRVYHDNNTCFRDVVVTLQPQDCSISCHCEEYIYLNETTDGGKIHKFQVNESYDPTTDPALQSILTEIGEPWFHNIAYGETVISPHGLGADLNGFLYIGETSEGDIRRFTCDGTIIPVDSFAILEDGGYNFASIDNVLYVNHKAGAVETNTINAYDLCTGNPLGYYCLDGLGISKDWGLFMTNEGTMYVTSDFNTNGSTNDSTNHLYKWDIYSTPLNPVGTASPICIDPFISSGNTDVAINSNLLPRDKLFGVTQDLNGNIYIVQRFDEGVGDAPVGAPSNSARILKYDSNGILVDVSTIDVLDGDGGYFSAIGIYYSVTIDKLFVSTASPSDDCVSLFDTDLNYLGPAIPATGDASQAKGINIKTECCPVPNIVSIDTTLCGDYTAQQFFLQDFLGCTGIICEGIWQPDASNVGMTFNDCDNSVTINSSDACGSFTLGSDGSHPNSQCGAFKISLNINIATPPAASVFAIQPSCTNGNPNNDGYLQISEITSGSRFNWSIGSTYIGDPDYVDATDTTGLTFPHIFNTGIANPNGSQDYTIRVFSDTTACGEMCYTDYTVTMNEQDCSVGCNCDEYIYLNEPDIWSNPQGTVHKFQIQPDGSVIEIGNPWFENITELPLPHGLASDLNGYLYIAENSSGDLRRLSCDGTIHPESDFVLTGEGGWNFASIGNHIFINRPTSGDVARFDVCTAALIDAVQYCESYFNDWGFHYDERTGYFYSAGAAWQADGPYVHRFTIDDFGSGNCVPAFLEVGDGTVTIGESELPDNHIADVTTDSNGNIYITVGGFTNNPGEEDSQIFKYDPNGNFVDSTSIDIVEGDGGWYGVVGLLYSPSTGYLYTSNNTQLDDCVSIFDTNLNYIGAAVGATGLESDLSAPSKSIDISTECCPTNNNVTIDTIICNANLGDNIFLQELINCNKTICEGLWKEENSNTGLTYNSCNNSITINSLDACGIFTLESDGTGANAQCGAFAITVNIAVLDNPTVTLIPDSTICAGETITLYGILDTAGGPTYQWQSSTTSCTTGFTNIMNATDSTYISTPMDTTYYRLITSSIANCASGNCADTSACVSVYPTDSPQATVADVLKCTSNSETIEVQASGGTMPYTYSWSGPFITNPGNTSIFTASSPGTYTVTVTDADGCIITTSGEMTFQSKVCLPATFTIKRGARN